MTFMLASGAPPRLDGRTPRPFAPLPGSTSHRPCVRRAARAVQPRRQPGRGRTRSAAATPAGDDSDPHEASVFPALLAGLAVALDAAPPGGGPAAARAFAASNPGVTSYEFMAWLADAEDRAPAPARPAISRAGAALTAVREGLDAAGFDAVQAAAAAYAADVGGALPQAGVSGGGPDDDEGGGEDDDAALATHLAARWAALGAARAVSPSGLAAGQAAAAGLGTAVTAARAASATELLGRRVLDAEAGPRAAKAAGDALAAAAAAGRVLAFLLDEPDRAARLGLLADALDPGDGEAQGDDDDDESGELEFISTTPLRLVQAVDLALARLARGGGGGVEEGGRRGGGAPSLPGKGPPAAPDGGPALEAVLLELRRAALDAWDEGGGGGEPPPP